MSRIIKSETAL